MHAQIAITLPAQEVNLDATLLSSTAPRVLTLNDVSEAELLGFLPAGFGPEAGYEEVLGWPIPLMAYWLVHYRNVTVSIPEVRKMVALVNCPEGGDYGKIAQRLVTPEPESAFPQRKARSKKVAKPDPLAWEVNGFALLSVLFEMAEARYAAGTWRPAAWG